MDVTKFGHACTRIDKDGQRLVIDPGGPTPEHMLDGATAGFDIEVHGEWQAQIHRDGARPPGRDESPPLPAAGSGRAHRI